jgi:3'-phosphoadenosine 5'-phosphosulfate (PAPS) 3'-phosphatase
MQEVASLVGSRETVRIGSVGIKAGAIAEGHGDFYLSMGTFGEWDICAPELLLREAGGMMTDRTGGPLSYQNPDYRIANGIVASNGICHEDVLKALTQVDA